MSFRHSCFISYKNSKRDTTRDFIEQLCDALDDWTDMYLDGQETFRDEARLQGGDPLEPALSKALVESVCMLAVLGPRYFLSEWCYREYLGALCIAEQRRTHTGFPEAGHCMVIPLLVWGEMRHVPAELRDSKVILQLPYSMLKPGFKLKRDPNAIPVLNKIRDIIHDRFSEHDTDSAQQAVACCADFSLPACPAEGPWTGFRQKPTAPPPGLPGRSRPGNTGTNGGAA